MNSQEISTALKERIYIITLLRLMAAIAAAANETWEYDCSVINNIMKYTI